MSTSALKTLFTDMVQSSGDFSKLSKDIKNQMLKVFVKETQPYFLVSDSFFFVPAYFTRSALDEFEKKFGYKPTGWCAKKNALRSLGNLC